MQQPQVGARARTRVGETLAHLSDRWSAQPVLGRPLGRQSGSEPRLVARAGAQATVLPSFYSKPTGDPLNVPFLTALAPHVAAPVYLSDTVPEKVNGR